MNRFATAVWAMLALHWMLNAHGPMGDRNGWVFTGCYLLSFACAYVAVYCATKEGD